MLVESVFTIESYVLGWKVKSSVYLKDVDSCYGGQEFFVLETQDAGRVGDSGRYV
jgi:hypothetical protein